MNFVIDLLISVDWKGYSYDSILVIVDRLTKRVYYKLIKVTINTPGLAEVIIDEIMYYHKVLESIVMDRCNHVVT